ncbi:hypothetical protein ABMA28_009243 [Loxostege sticticalis]|uniref:Uncharacterized protein n=1 Tax=Loxostege sticticalis TaxID=481309 RepID=A0ABD0SCL9_LOXSC
MGGIGENFNFFPFVCKYRINNINESSTSKSMHSKHMDCQIETSNNPAGTMTPRKLKLTMNLQRKALVAENRRKKIALRSKARRLVKKNAELTDIIENL